LSVTLEPKERKKDRRNKTVLFRLSFFLSFGSSVTDKKSGEEERDELFHGDTCDGLWARGDASTKGRNGVSVTVCGEWIDPFPEIAAAHSVSAGEAGGLSRAS
jgi:hypothetical protein